MEGGTITGNRSDYGGGVFVARGGRFNLSGAPVISGNTKADGTTASNIYLLLDAVITVAGNLTNTTPCGVTMDQPGRFTVGYQ